MFFRKRAASADASSNAQGGRGLQYCLSPLLFEGSGGLLLKTPSGLTVQSILRLTSHCSLRAHITVQEWFNAASAIGGITNEVAQNVFDVFAAVSVKSAEVRIQQSRAILAKLGDAGTHTTNATAALSGRTVSLPGLMLFLMAQIALEKPPRAASLEGVSVTDHVLNFIKQHLHEVVSAVAVTKAGRVSMSDLTELRVILREFNSGTEAPVGSNLMFLWPRGEQTVDCAVVSQFIRQRLVSPTEVKAAFNTCAVHRNLPGASHIMQSAPPPRPSSLFTLSSCSQSSIYVLAPLPSTLLVGLANCLVVLGPVAGVLTIQQCQNCQIVALCGAVSISACKDVELYVCTNSPPVLPSAKENEDATMNERVLIGPYNTFYASLEEHLGVAGINPKLNLFRVGVPQQYIMAPSGADGCGFSPMVVPATPSTHSNSVTTRTNPVPLPPEYADAIAARQEKFLQTTAMLQAAYKQLEDSGRRDLAESLRVKVHRAFTDWMVDAGQAKSVLDLLGGVGGGTTVA